MRQNRILAMLAAACVTLSALGLSAPAQAATNTDDVETALQAAGVMPEGVSHRATQSTDTRPAALSDDGLTISGDSGELLMAPVMDAAPTWSTSGVPVYRDSSDAAIALTHVGHGANAGYAVVFNANAPDEYGYELTVGGQPAHLTATPNGGIEVRDAHGELVNLIGAPWATDANGAAVPTEYRIDGNILIQVVRHGAGTTYPVVADPRLMCDGLWCTMELTRHETALMADSALNAGIVCGVMGPGVVPCTALVIGGWAMANIARANGQCIGVRVWQANMITNMHLAYVRCYA